MVMGGNYATDEIRMAQKCSAEDVVASQCFQLTNDCGAHKSAMPGHEHPGGFC